MTIKKSITYLLIILIIGSIIFFTLYKKEEVSLYTTEKIKIGTIKQTVSETGTVKSDLGIDLSFLNSGKLKTLNFKVGDKIKEGDLIAELDFSALQINRNEVQANLDVARGNLNKLLSGATLEDIAVSKATVDQARKSYESAKKEFDKTVESSTETKKQAEKTLEDLESVDYGYIPPMRQAVITAKTNLENTRTTYQNIVDNYIENAVSISDDKLTVINTVLDIVDRTLTDDDGKDLISKKKPEYLTNTWHDYNKAIILLQTAESNLIEVENEVTNGEVSSLVSNTYFALSKTFDCLQNCYIALENSITSTDFSKAELDALKLSISSQQTIISAAIQSIQAIEQNLNSAILNLNNNLSVAQDSLANTESSLADAIIKARNALSTAEINGDKQTVLAESKVNNAFEAWQVSQAQFNKLVAQADKYDVSLLRAKIRQVEASLKSVLKKIEDSKIISSIDGIITKINFEIGEQVSGGLSVISLIKEKKFEIEVMITEADISKIKIDDKVQITLDSFGDDIKFYGSVYFIDPAETIIDGVIYYKIKIDFGTDERKIKSGMTANVTITTDEKENVLILPTRSLVNKDNDGWFARILKDGILKEEKVELGLYGDSGVVEVLSGVAEGEEAVTYIKK
ncbi:efflux RND transporter periplasmic adaptor subunit [Candidatus Parcubacteria bacterium]|nr:efflux RND transporter periplasmic adaptor subunit [Candidatus Parcubacteria bacterium]